MVSLGGGIRRAGVAAPLVAAGRGGLAGTDDAGVCVQDNNVGTLVAMAASSSRRDGWLIIVEYTNPP